ncbi:hypothetical protein [Halarcobacter sp.]|uniref:hypothetical protein n=1 Tax=Halarcobacter sp. TaxID=2321133 RepID=UPI002AAB17F2|nr:hypothetical protein [Halarcobacter sp.]
MADEFDFDLEGFEDELNESLKEGKETFKGKYEKQLNDLSALAKIEFDSIAPNVDNLEKYNQLIKVVKKASEKNLNQAQLKEQILKLGDIAIKIAEKIPSLAAIIT